MGSFLLEQRRHRLWLSVRHLSIEPGRTAPTERVPIECHLHGGRLHPALDSIKDSFTLSGRISNRAGNLRSEFCLFQHARLRFPGILDGHGLAGLEQEMTKYNDAIRQLKQGHV